MASTIQLARTIDLTQRAVRNAPLKISTAGDPAYSNADWVRQFILAAPFAWPWNRTKSTINCVVGQQDYAVALATFGWIEKATITDPTLGNEAHELTVELSLSKETIPNEPTRIAAQIDDGAGNITFRLMPPPDKPYAIEIVTQNAAPLFTDDTDTWEPIPDRFAYLYNQGMLAKAFEYLDDPRFGEAMQLFLRQVIAAHGGLDETQVNLFLADQMNSTRESQAVQQNGQFARQGRGMY